MGCVQQKQSKRQDALYADQADKDKGPNGINSQQQTDLIQKNYSPRKQKGCIPNKTQSYYVKKIHSRSKKAIRRLIIDFYLSIFIQKQLLFLFRGFLIYSIKKPYQMWQISRIPKFSLIQVASFRNYSPNKLQLTVQLNIYIKKPQYQCIQSNINQIQTLLQSIL
ncbi:unnamed protein product (macronuclear) [Paramecium tetraurelia]|uniref:Transmembrane protein n=1 Tax=Paramecium tetraurelia TaxID=5888 RepID=A0CG54_PARTE|nr:uncharacterized protein GSPATT00038215001 [Paramecium tetraurelia]CAK69771.1 unnamed protein product [Paramecium tetraurelia]|eukprot:XP_001437168.1 hypothetical protein (macronuclear) [Paramecium tetraurelia strain d4-2]